MTTDIARSRKVRYTVPYVFDSVCPGCGQVGRADELCRFCWVPVPNPKAPDEETERAPESDTGEAWDKFCHEADTVLERDGAE